MRSERETSSPLLRLDESELEFITQLVLHSGSIKDVAAHYGVSYPTLRLRLDRIITRLNEIIAGRPPDPMNELLATLIERGEMTPGTARQIQKVWRENRTKAED